MLFFGGGLRFSFSRARRRRGLTCSETYGGALSDKSYQTPDAAISAYISDEINPSASVTDSRKLRDLSQDEISALPLTEELKIR